MTFLAPSHRYINICLTYLTESCGESTSLFTVTNSIFTDCLCTSIPTPALVSLPSSSLHEFSSLIKNLFLYSSISPKPRNDDLGGFISSSDVSMGTELLAPPVVTVNDAETTTGGVLTTLLLVEITDVLIDRELVVVTVAVAIVDATVVAVEDGALSDVVDTDDGESTAFGSGALVLVGVIDVVVKVADEDGLATAAPVGAPFDGADVAGGVVDAEGSEG